ncbi:hypothetical protein CDL15_Pgr023915 [Punica granatum]|uniref:Uncharacterized protein n=1 Tax=Punica granatum TaxID=22663 RepID=A0A218XWT5_PUNGR|nr:hypothetical protein CDL15_Pgr023915 [Punica granatum]PKI52655.1 hypothetical protein CRG98_026995 [Punica granatum]
MGLGISEEFMPLTPIRTSSAGTRKTLEPVSRFHDPDDECQTPKSVSNILTPPPVCPPAPVKPRSSRRKLALASTRRFYQVPDDLASVFVPITGSNKKLRTC